MGPNYIYNETKLISNVHNDCSCECFLYTCVQRYLVAQRWA